MISSNAYLIDHGYFLDFTVMLYDAKKIGNYFKHFVQHEAHDSILFCLVFHFQYDILKFYNFKCTLTIQQVQNKASEQNKNIICKSIK